MNKRGLLTLILILLIIGLIIGITKNTHAQPVAFSIPKMVIASGGMGVHSGDYTIRSTLGQPVAGIVTEEPYILESGFWTKISEMMMEVINFFPLIMR